MRFRLRWPFVLRSTHEAALSGVAIAYAKADRAREAAETHTRNMVDEVKVARDTLDRVLSWKAAR